jgi:hypothetical protein
MVAWKKYHKIACTVQVFLMMNTSMVEACRRQYH